jgi:hypothetical protein
MKEITSKKTGKKEIVSDYIWDNIVSRGWAKKFKTSDVPERKLIEVPLIIEPPEIKIIRAERPAEIRTKTKKIKNGQKD